MDIKYMNENLMPSGHQTRKQRYNKVENPMIGIITQGTIVTIIKNMDIFPRISLEYIQRKLQ